MDNRTMDELKAQADRRGVSAAVEIDTPYLSIREVAERLGTHEKTVSGMVRVGAFPGAKKIGSQGRTSPWRIPEDAVNAYFRAA